MKIIIILFMMSLLIFKFTNGRSSAGDCVNNSQCPREGIYVYDPRDYCCDFGCCWENQYMNTNGSCDMNTDCPGRHDVSNVGYCCGDVCCTFIEYYYTLIRFFVGIFTFCMLLYIAIGHDDIPTDTSYGRLVDESDANSSRNDGGEVVTRGTIGYSTYFAGVPPETNVILHPPSNETLHFEKSQTSQFPPQYQDIFPQNK